MALKDYSTKEMMAVKEGTWVRIKDTWECDQVYKIGGKLVFQTSYMVEDKEKPFGIKAGNWICFTFPSVAYELLSDKPEGYDEEQIAASDTLPEIVRQGGACRFCERHFLNKAGQPFSYGKLAVCHNCYQLPGVWRLAYQYSKLKTAEPESIWALKKSEILRELGSEVGDWDAGKVSYLAIKEERKERFDEEWFPVFKTWLKEKITWDEKTERFILDLGEQGKLDFYPKRNQLLVRKENKWYTGGLNTLKKRFLPDEFKPSRIVHNIEEQGNKESSLIPDVTQ